MNIYQRVNEVRKQVAYIKKDAKVLNYKAVTHDAVIATIRPSLIENGIITVPTLVDESMAPTGTKTKSGTPIMRYEAKFCISFVNMDEPQDRIEMSVPAHANDEGDKAPGKALSYAVKMAELKLFNIETGESDESRIEALPMSAFNAETMEQFANKMLQALQDDNGHWVIGRSLQNDKDLWEATNTGTRGKGSGYYSANEKERFGHKNTQYSNALNEYVDGLSQAAEDGDVGAADELLAELDDPTDKKLVWARLNDQVKVFIKNLKEAA